MKIAIFHDYIGAIGGGEKLVLTLAKELGADVITTDVDMSSVKKMGYEDINIISIGNTVKISPLKQISASWKFTTCDFSDKYDFFIISGNWAVFAAKKHKPNLYYCHTPVRVFYDLNETFLKRQSLLSELPFKLWVTIHRKAYENNVTHIGQIVANSNNVKKRIKDYLDRDSIVINPPIDVSRFKPGNYDNYWLSVNRIYPEKRIELQIEAFKNRPNEKLLIIGGFAEADHASKYYKSIVKQIPENIKLLGTINENKLRHFYENCKGFITTPIDEDFGMTPVEAMAAGKAVIGMNEGGCLETIVNESTGFLVHPNVEEIVKAIDIISSNPSIFKEKCIEQAQIFDVKNFIIKMKNQINMQYP
jgi:glycosyltransferase involved in cell wall biosynthesis